MGGWAHSRLIENATAPDWPPERVHALRALLATGASYSQIGKKLGVSRLAVSGKVTRLRQKAKLVARAEVSPAPTREEVDALLALRKFSWER